MLDFGVRFGALVRQKRGVEGLTQEALAFKAFGPGGRKAQISDLERGKIANPQASTVDPLVVALNISDEELCACRETVELPAEGDRPDLPPLLLQNLAMRFGIASPDAPAAKLEAYLRDAAKDYAEMKARLDALAEADGRIANLVGAAKGALDQGEFAEADARLADAEEIQQTEHTLVQVRKQAKIRAERGKAALMNFDVDAAYGRFREAAAFFEPFDKAESARELRSHGIEMRNHGLRFPGDAPARVVDLWKKKLLLLDRDNDAETWGVAQNDLGIALQEQGIRAEGVTAQTLVAEAVAAFRTALEVRTQDAMPVQWAMTQNNLGNALCTQGSRAEGEAGLTLLAEAVTAFRAALEVQTREAMPVGWADVQNNLGNALSEQGFRAEGEAGLTLLAEAVTAYRATLEVCTRDAMPVDWAMTQNNLGETLRNQSSRAEGEAAVTLLAEAVTAFRAALEVRTRDAMPVQWAMTQNNLGIALSDQGERTEGEAGLTLLAEAVTAHRAALEVRTRDTMPVDWAMTHNNLGVALQEQGIRTEGEAGLTLLAEAVTAYRAALEVYTRDTMPVDWAMAHHNLGVALQEQGERAAGEAGLSLLAEAVAAYCAALEVRTRDTMPVDWAETNANLAIAFEAMAEKAPDQQKAHLQTALTHVDLSLEIFDPEHMPRHFGNEAARRERILAKLAALGDG